MMALIALGCVQSFLIIPSFVVLYLHAWDLFDFDFDFDFWVFQRAGKVG